MDDDMYDRYDNTSLMASLEDFEHERSPMFGNHSTHSAFRSEESEAESERSSAPWSPPAWRKGSSGWLRQHRFPPPGASLSHSTSPLYESAGEGDDTILPANVPLPASPPKQTPADTPGASPEYERREYPQPFGGGYPARDKDKDRDNAMPSPEQTGSYIRFAMRAEVQHGTDPYTSMFTWIRETYKARTRTTGTTLQSLLMAFVAWTLLKSVFRPPTPLPTPDLLKATQIARTFEPLIYYSENGVQQISDLQETSVAIWDLGESIRSTNMTSAPIIVSELDDLSESMKTLAIQLTSFFANVDGDVDGILIVMEWAKRRLQTIEPAASSTSMTSALDNVHNLLSRVGILESADGPTILGRVVKEVLGETPSQRNAVTLRRTFDEFLTVLEESINNELMHSIKLFGLFERIDHQFLNLQRSVIRETDQQEHEEDVLLGSLWARVIGTRASSLKKFDKNKQLLVNVRQRTVQNKGILLDHNGKLLQLKSNLEVLRKKLVSPLVRSNDSNVLSVEEQIAGLDDTYAHLKNVRERQKQKTLEMLYSSGSRRIAIKAEESYEIGSGGR